MTESAVSLAIEHYTGRKLATLLTHEDPEARGTFGFRATFTEGETIDFLTVGVPLANVTHEHLEECDFATWPPKSHLADWMVR